MAHKCSEVIINWLDQQSIAVPNSATINSDIAQEATLRLRDDAIGFLYSAIISFISAIEGLDNSRFTWSIVKLYYSSFYAARSILASNNTCVFYRNRKSYSVTFGAINKPKKENISSTHKLIWSIYKREFPNDVLLNKIDDLDSYEWLINLREEVNYRNAKFADPIVPRCFSQVDIQTIPRCLDIYNRDINNYFSFDPDHAIISFPVACMRKAYAATRRTNVNFDDDDKKHIEDGYLNIRAPRGFLFDI